MTSEPLPFSAACERNKAPILEVLEQVLPRAGNLLEIGSGTGQHVVYFSSRFPGLRWQPSDREENLPGLFMRIQEEGGNNILPPVLLDVLGPWPEARFEAIYSANTAHIMSWRAVCALFEGVALHLSEGGVFCLYGPFNENGEFTAPSNAAFHQKLRLENPEMGLRDIADLEKLARKQHLRLVQRFSLPANNQILQFRLLSGDSGSPKPQGS